jgi:hypothetical protein
MHCGAGGGGRGRLGGRNSIPHQSPALGCHGTAALRPGARMLHRLGAGGPAPAELLSRATSTVPACKAVNFCLLCMPCKVSARRARRKRIFRA